MNQTPTVPFKVTVCVIVLLTVVVFRRLGVIRQEQADDTRLAG